MNINEICHHKNNSLGQKCQDLAIRLVEKDTGYTVINAVGGRLCGTLLKPLARILDVVKHIFYTLTHLVFGPLAFLKHQTIGRCTQLSPQTYFVTHGFTHLGIANTFLWEIVPSLSNLIDPRIYKQDTTELDAANQERDASRTNHDTLLQQMADLQTTIADLQRTNQNLTDQLNQQQQPTPRRNTPPPPLPRDITLPDQTGQPSCSSSHNPLSERSLSSVPDDANNQLCQELDNLMTQLDQIEIPQPPPPPPQQQQPCCSSDPNPISPSDRSPSPDVTDEEIHQIAETDIKREGIQGLLEQIRNRPKSARRSIESQTPTELDPKLVKFMDDLWIDMTKFYNYKDEKELWNNSLANHYKHPTDGRECILPKQVLDNKIMFPESRGLLVDQIEAAAQEIGEWSQLENSNLLSVQTDVNATTLNALNLTDVPTDRVNILAEKFGRLFRTLRYIELEAAKIPPKTSSRKPEIDAKIEAEKARIRDVQQKEKRKQEMMRLGLESLYNHNLKLITNENQFHPLNDALKNQFQSWNKNRDVKQLDDYALINCLNIMKGYDKFNDQYNILGRANEQAAPKAVVSAPVAGPSSSNQVPYSQPNAIDDDIDWETDYESLPSPAASIDPRALQNISSDLIAQFKG